MTNADTLPFNVKQAVLKYLASPQHKTQTFKIYCDQQQSIFGGPGTEYRVRVQKYKQDTRKRVQLKYPDRFLVLLQYHNLDTKGNPLETKSGSDESSNSLFPSPPPKPSKMTKPSPRLKYRDDYDDCNSDDDEFELPESIHRLPPQGEFMRTRKFSYHCIWYVKCDRLANPRFPFVGSWRKD
jgi:hypothetical protein